MTLFSDKFRFIFSSSPFLKFHQMSLQDQTLLQEVPIRDKKLFLSASHFTARTHCPPSHNMMAIKLKTKYTRQTRQTLESLHDAKTQTHKST